MDEKRYNEITPAAHRKALGQYFTPRVMAAFMTAWACGEARTMLDPAVGNSVFLRAAEERYPGLVLTGYELDGGILAFFGNPANARIVNGDYLKSGWDETYDAIVCNPPYHRFQNVPEREAILADFAEHTGVRLSGYTNLYALFLVKSLFQLSERGRLAYVVPSEFLNSRYGAPVKRLLTEKKLLRAVIDLPDDAGLFPGAVTTCCVLLADREAKEGVGFFSLPSAEALGGLPLDKPPLFVRYEALSPSEKWRRYLRREEEIAYRNLRPVSDFCRVSRGIATGANEFFCFSRSKIARYGLPERCFTPCVCRSADIGTPILTAAGFDALDREDRTVWLMDIAAADTPAVAEYVQRGEALGVDKRYLPSRRRPWYSMEQKPAAPIWVTTAGRGGMKFVRNRAGVVALTTFHSVFAGEKYADDVELLFAVFLTPTAQAILRRSRKELGNGLEKFQPNDLNEAQMPDIDAFSRSDRGALLSLVTDPTPEHIAAMDEIVRRYVV